MRLSGSSEQAIQEASAAAAQVVGFSAYLHGIGYDVQKFRRELDESVDYIKGQQQASQQKAA